MGTVACRGGAAAAACAAVIALSGCALISGPCSFDLGLRRLTCEPGGVMVLWRPAATIEAIAEAAPAWRQQRPHEGP